ncbi:MAG TPA: TerB family tellurite resistance protein [Candidatus Limnocylindrales bacterium]|jgi:tellurite resistance protein
MFRRFLGLPERPPGSSGPDAARSAEEGLTGAPSAFGETDTVRRIVARLDALPPDRARHLAGFAYILARAAEADLDISAEETAVMEHAIVEFGGLDEAQAILVTQMAKLQARARGATEDFLVTREFARIASDEEKKAVVRTAFTVVAANDSISADEASVVNEIARELDIDRPTLNAIREEFVEKIEAIRAAHRLEGSSPGG